MKSAHTEVWRQQLAFIRSYIFWLGRASAGAEVWEAPGVVAAIVPIAALRSLPNSVAPESAQALAASYDELAKAYADAGVETWTVWLHEDDAEARAFLEAKGHELDGAPVAMAMNLSEWEPEDLGDLDWDTEAGFDELGRLNDLAYGYDPESGMASAIVAPPDDSAIRLYRARADGEVACVLGTIDEGDDSGIIFVATAPAMRGRGLASRLMTAALIEARDRGMRTTSLQASALGSPIYERLGYRTYFRFNIMERRSGRPDG